MFLLTLVACGEEKEVEVGVKYSVYENEGSDMISFYMTGDGSKWQYALAEDSIFEIFYDPTEENDGVYYQTLVLKPKSEGEETLTFTLEEQGDRVYEATVKKDKDGVLRITVKE